jgi:uncharacterized protein
MAQQQFYTEAQRVLQDANGTRALADRLALGMTRELSDADIAFVESVDMFFLSTVDNHGRPTVSYKGGDPGFVRVPTPSTLRFPIYDGNGMFLSLGNMSESGEVGLLFISFDRPFRLRIQGRASVSDSPEDTRTYKEAIAVVDVEISEAFMNCPRYVHRKESVSQSRYVPREGIDTPLAEWKRIEGIASELPARDADAVARVGNINGATWVDQVRRGDENV